MNLFACQKTNTISQAGTPSTVPGVTIIRPANRSGVCAKNYQYWLGRFKDKSNK